MRFIFFFPVGLRVGLWLFCLIYRWASWWWYGDGAGATRYLRFVAACFDRGRWLVSMPSDLGLFLVGLGWEIWLPTILETDLGDLEDCEIPFNLTLFA